MDPSEPQSPPPQGKQQVEPHHRSFVQRLQGRFGKGVDPRISLQDQDEASDTEQSPSRDLYLKLSTKDPGSLRYSVRGELARGGMGAIMRVWDDDLRRNLAMKVLIARKRPRGDDDDSVPTPIDEELLGRFLEEAQITGQLDHPGIVPVHDLGIDERGRVYFTMRLVRGRDLKQIFALMAEGKEGWSRAKALGVILKVCEAMAFAHSKGVVHRDLKPANIMVGRFGETYVMDWGLARVIGRRDSHDMRLKGADGSQLSLVRTARHEDQQQDPQSPLVTMDGDVIGTPSYMAPEQAEGRLEDVGPRSDVYSAGSILYQILTGQAPYVKPGSKLSPHTVLTRVLDGPPAPVHRLAKDVPAELVAICEKAMARDPGLRYGGMLDMAADIEAFLEGRVVGAYEAGAVAEFRKWVTRNRGMAAAIGVASALTVGGLATVVVQQSRKADELEVHATELKVARDRAEAKEAEALEARGLAERREGEARDATALAEENAERARRGSYTANIVAADYSLRLNEVTEAQKFLELCDEDLHGWEWKHLDLKLKNQHSTVDSRAPVGDVGFLADGRTAYSMARTGALRFYDLAPGSVRPVGQDGGHVRLWQQFMQFPDHVAFEVSPDGSRAAVVGAFPRRKVLLGDLEALRRGDSLAAGGENVLPRGDEGAGHRDEVTCAAFGPAGERLVSGSNDGTAIVWDLATGGILRRLEGHARSVLDVEWSPDGALVATAAYGSAFLWDAESGDLLHDLDGHEGLVPCLAFSGDGKRLATGSEGRRVRLWDVSDGRLLQTLDGHTGPVTALAFSPDDRFLASGSEDRTLRVWGRGHGERFRPTKVFFGHEDPITCLAFSPDGGLILTGSLDGTLRTWDPETGGAFTQLEEAGTGTGDVSAVDFSPDGSRCLTGMGDGRILIWDAWAGEVMNVLRGHKGGGRISSAVWSRDGRWILSGSGDKSARLWDASTGVARTTFRGHGKFIRSVALSGDGTWALTGSGDKTARIWDVESGKTILTLEGHRSWVNAVAVGPDDERVYTGSSDSTVRVWDASTGELVLTLEEEERDAGVRSIALTADGTRLAAGRDDGSTCMWDARNGEHLFTMRGGLDPVQSLDFDSLGARLISGSADKTVRVWDARTGDYLLGLVGHTGPVSSVAFSADDTRILSGSFSVRTQGMTSTGVVDQTARIWETGELADRRERRLAAKTLREEADPVVEELFSRYFFASSVLSELEKRRMEDDVRRAAMAMILVRGDNPGRLTEQCWSIVRRADATPEEYDRARAQAEAARAMSPDDPLCVAVHAMAQFRLSQYAAALHTMKGVKPREPGDKSKWVAFRAFGAMAHHHLGHAEEARAAATEVVGMIRSAGVPAEGLAVVREAEALLGFDLLDELQRGPETPPGEPAAAADSGR